MTDIEVLPNYKAALSLLSRAQEDYKSIMDLFSDAEYNTNRFFQYHIASAGYARVTKKITCLTKEMLLIAKRGPK